MIYSKKQNEHMKPYNDVIEISVGAGVIMTFMILLYVILW
jgi:hypothetical protein